MGLRVYTGGTFDLLHWGHIEFLKRCSEIGEVVVSLNTDEFIADYKGKSPIMTFSERKKALEGLKYVSEVIPNYGGVDSRIAIEIARPDIICVGSDWARKNYYDQMNFTQRWLDERNISLCYIPYTTGISSTEIKNRLG